MEGQLAGWVGEEVMNEGPDGGWIRGWTDRYARRWVVESVVAEWVAVERMSGWFSDS